MSKSGWIGVAGGVVAVVGAVIALPEIIVAGAAVAVGAAVVEGYNRWAQSKHCQRCANSSESLKILDWTWLAEDHRRTVTRVCPNCFDHPDYADYRRYEHAVENSSSITVFSARYNGHIPTSTDPMIDVASAWFLDKDDAEKSLQVTACYLGKNYVAQVKEARRSVGDTPVRSEWRYIGLAGISRV